MVNPILISGLFALSVGFGRGSDELGSTSPAEIASTPGSVEPLTCEQMRAALKASAEANSKLSIVPNPKYAERPSRESKTISVRVPGTVSGRTAEEIDSLSCDRIELMYTLSVDTPAINGSPLDVHGNPISGKMDAKQPAGEAPQSGGEFLTELKASLQGGSGGFTASEAAAGVSAARASLASGKSQDEASEDAVFAAMEARLAANQARRASKPSRPPKPGLPNGLLPSDLISGVEQLLASGYEAASGFIKYTADGVYMSFTDSSLADGFGKTSDLASGGKYGDSVQGWTLAGQTVAAPVTGNYDILKNGVGRDAKQTPFGKMGQNFGDRAYQLIHDPLPWRSDGDWGGRGWHRESVPSGVSDGSESSKWPRSAKPTGRPK